MPQFHINLVLSVLSVFAVQRSMTQAWSPAYLLSKQQGLVHACAAIFPVSRVTPLEQCVDDS